MNRIYAIIALSSSFRLSRTLSLGRTLQSSASASAPSIFRHVNISASLRSSRSDSTFTRPTPPPLPKEEQKEFNRLIKEKGNQLQFNFPESAAAARGSGVDVNSRSSRLEDELHPNARKVPTPDFEGDTNPNTGEVGGPKKDPLQWEREWTYGGRTTDF